MPQLVGNISCDFSNYTIPTKSVTPTDGILFLGKGSRISDKMNKKDQYEGLYKYLHSGQIPPEPSWCSNNSWLLTVSMKNSFSSPDEFYNKMKKYHRFLEKHRLVEEMASSFEFYKTMDKLHMHSAVEFYNHDSKVKLWKQWTIEFFRYTEGFHVIKSISSKSKQFHLKKRPDVGPWQYVMKQAPIMTKLKFKPIFISSDNTNMTRLHKKLYTLENKVYRDTVYDPHTVRTRYHGSKREMMVRLLNENLSLSDYNKKYIQDYNSEPHKEE